MKSMGLNSFQRFAERGVKELVHRTRFKPCAASFEHLKRPPDRFGLVDRFLSFALGVGVGDNPSPCPYCRLAFLNAGSPDGDRQIHVPGEGKISDCPTIWTARLIFDLSYNFHSPDFRSACKGPGRERGAEKVECVQP